MPRGSVKDVKTKCRNMRKSKLKEVCESELTEEEMEIFLMKIADKYYNSRISQEVGKCEKSVSNIFMSAKSNNQSGNGNGRRDNSGAGGVNAANARDINIVHTDGKNFLLALIIGMGMNMLFSMVLFSVLLYIFVIAGK